MSDQEPEPTADEIATAAHDFLEELLDGTATPLNVLDASNVINHNG